MTTESAQQRDELASEYVLGTLSAPEREAVQQRLRNEPELQAAVDAWERRLLDLTDLAGTHPPSPHGRGVTPDDGVERRHQLPGIPKHVRRGQRRGTVSNHLLLRLGPTVRRAVLILVATDHAADPQHGLLVN